MVSSQPFLYVEVPRPKKSANSVRSATDDLHKNNGQASITKTVGTEKIVSVAAEGISKGKGREQVDAEVSHPTRPSRSPAPSNQAAAGSSTTTRIDLPQMNAAGPSSSTSVTQSVTRSNNEDLLAPPMSKIGSSSSTALSSLKPESDESRSPAVVRQNGKPRRRNRKKMIIHDSDESDGEQAGPSTASRLKRDEHQSPRGIASGIQFTFPTTAEEIEYAKLGVDEEITRVLGRKRYGPHFAYAVKLKDRSKVFVPETALDQCPDLLEEYTDLLESGWREDGKIHSDSGSDGDDKGKQKASDDSDAYSEDGNPGEKKDADSEGDMDVDTSDEGTNLSSADIPLQQQASRRSNREAAQKKVDYSKQAEYNEEDDMMSEESEDSSEEATFSVDVPLSKQRRCASSDSDFEVVSRPSHQNKQRPQASSTDGKSAGDTGSDEQFVEGGIQEKDLRPEQFHSPNCAQCKASSARRLLPEYIRKEKRKRKRQNEEGDWDASSIKAYGSWIQCEVCSGSWHWKCLPGYHSATGMRIVFKKMVDTKYGAGAHLSINKTFKIASCPDCLKPEGSTCKFCRRKEPVRDITEGIEKSFGPPEDQSAPSSTVANNTSQKSFSTAGDDISKGASPGQPTSEENPTGRNATSASEKDLLFRCIQCRRTAHYSCIPDPHPADLWQYSWDWHCNDCKTWGPIDAVLAWRPLDWNEHKAGKEGTPAPSSPKRVAPSSPGKQPSLATEIPDHKAPWWNAEYLVKFKERSFRKATWVPHSWLFSAYKQRLRNFLVDGPLIDITPDNATRDGEDDVAEDHLENFSLQPTPNAFELIPKEWLTPDRVLDVRLKRKSTGGNDPRLLNTKNRISNDPEDTLSRVSEMYVKWQGLPYESATWETDIPKPDEPQYEHFLQAYGEYLKFRDAEIPKLSQKELAFLDRARPKSQFKELIEQPDFITLGKLMDFQLLGVSWLYYNWWIKKGCILADEMGLGKTVQIISFLSILFRVENCKPFLVVVPNSTLQNWQREFTRWAPADMRVVPYYGSKASRGIIEEFELFSEGSVSEQRLRTHVVLTTYESLSGDTALFKRVPRWEALVVDEAQRLKSGSKNLLWRALKTLRFGHTVLLTGTPVNNNLDELFNLLSFLDPDSFKNLDELHTRYENLTPELVAEVQDIAQPYFLRRTKEAVLNLPPLSEVILPLSMSPLQKLVYKSVLEKNMDALKAIYDASKAKTKKKVMTGKVVNVLMELRKTLCHPYLVRDELEHDTNLDAKTVHKNLVEASSKLTFLAGFLPKLKERGHRVLLFSQFAIVLNVIERFLEGMKVKFVRLDGNTSQAQRQKFIDAYNAPDSDIFIFILTTRAGGVGINLATADTVILFDADFNPFQDLQAISRAHRIGQTRKVMCFKLMVKGTCEEKIIETGKKKMVLEQLIVDSKETKNSEDEEAVNNVESLLLFGAKALFSEEPETAAQNEITYSERDIDELITKTENEEASAEEVEAKKIRTLEANKAFSYARVWDRQVRAEEEEADKREVEAQRGFWSKMIEAKEKERKDEELARQLQMGRGYRRRQQTNYNVSGEIFSGSPATSGMERNEGSDSDDDEFDANMASDESDADDDVPAHINSEDLAGIDIHKNKKAKIVPPPVINGQQSNGYPAPLAPIRPTGPIYTDPLPINIAPDQPPHPRYELVRSPTPPEVSEKRTALIKNLLKRAELLRNAQAVALIRRATEASSGADQVILCQQATELLTAAVHAGSETIAGPSGSTHPNGY